MVNPDPEENPRGDAAWFAIVTWIQPASEVRRNKPRLVRSSSRDSLRPH